MEQSLTTDLLEYSSSSSNPTDATVTGNRVTALIVTLCVIMLRSNATLIEQTTRRPTTDQQDDNEDDDLTVLTPRPLILD